MQSATSQPSLNAISLDQCAKHAHVQVVDVANLSRFGSNDDQVTMRLKELGFLPGARLKVIGFGLLGRDPMAVQVNGTKFALRRAEASKIMVSPILVAGE